MTEIVKILYVLLLLTSCVPSEDTSTDETEGLATTASNSNGSSTTPGSEPLTLAAPGNLVDGSSDYVKDRSPEFEWDSVTDAVSYEVAIGSTSGGNEIFGWTNVGNVNVFQATGLSLTPGVYYASIRAIGPNGEIGSIATGDGWTVTACPPGYILVPGNSTTGLGGVEYTQGTQSNYNWSTTTETIRTSADFCVMKYEAKDGGSHTAISVAAGTPWVSIRREQTLTDNDAQEACENNGTGFQLIGNHHWQAIARDIESVATNFSTAGAPADHTFNHGHADDNLASPGGANSTGALAADEVDENGCAGIGDETSGNSGSIPADCGGAWHVNKRTHSLSNGEVIWDFSGNVYEWVRDNSTTSQGTDGYIQAALYADALKWGPANDYSLQSSGQRAGLGYGYINYTAGAVFRGGDWNLAAFSGVFFARLAYGSGYSDASLGFRCVYTD